MEFQNIAQKLGFETYPTQMDALYVQMQQNSAPACDLPLIHTLQQDWNLFGKYYEAVTKTAEEINNDPLRSAWVKTASAFAKQSATPAAKKIPVPRADGSAVTDLLPLHILINLIPEAIGAYTRRGFSRDEIALLMQDFPDSIRIVEQQLGRPAVNALYYGWLMIYAKAEIFRAGGFWFELKTIGPNAMWLRNNRSGNVLCLMCTGSFERTGSYAVGSKYYEAPENSFSVTFEEDDEKFVGHGVFHNKVSLIKMTFSKDHWSCIARPGDPCVNLHIPRGADISMVALDKALADARELVATRYPEKPPMQVHCNSWLLDPKLGALLGPHARITQFMERFVKHPQLSKGSGPFGYVFPKTEDYASLPEHTSLQRKLKKLYLDGSCIYGCSGLLL